MILNPGGPALPGLTTVLGRRELGDTGARFDLIGMDPRFIGRSTPLDCGLSNNWLLLSAGADRRSFDQSVRRAKDVADKCVQTHGDELPYASTADTARDMDVIRAALGEAKLSYVGLSYGSYLGAVYTQLFGQHAGRIVLDSALDPARPGTLPGVDAGMARGAGLRDWAVWAAQHDAEYHLGPIPAAVLSRVDRIYQASAGHPLHVGTYLVDDSVVVGAMFDPLSDDNEIDSADLAAIVQVLDQAATTGNAQPTQKLAGTLADMLTGVNSNKLSARAAILCADATVPHDSESYWRDIQAHRASEPLFGPFDRKITPCAFWPTANRQPTVTVHNNVPAVVVGAAGDINAVFSIQQAMHRALTDSRMITLDGVRAHGVYPLWGSTCVNDAVNAYLNTGHLPAHDLTCARPAGQ